MVFVGWSKLVFFLGGVHLVDLGRRPRPLLGTDKEWVAMCPGLLRTGCSLGSLCLAPLIKMENFWLLNGSCGCWKIKGLCLKFRSSWRPVGLRRQWKKMFVFCLQFCILYNVLGGKADKGENHPLFLEPSQQLRFSDCGPNFTSFAGALLCSWNFYGSLFHTPSFLTTLCFAPVEFGPSPRNRFPVLTGTFLVLLKPHDMQMEGSHRVLCWVIFKSFLE